MGKINFINSNKLLSYLYLKRKIFQYIPNFYNNDFNFGKSFRSCSETLDYIAAVNGAVTSKRHFERFKRDYRYAVVLEHVSKELGEQYYSEINDKYAYLLDDKSWKKNDIEGMPITHEYSRVGLVSPTTLRYVKISGDIKHFFGDISEMKVAEIGCGYGGQALVLDSQFSGLRFEMFDLPEVNKLITKYLNRHLLSGSFSVNHINNTSNNNEYDLVISNYAFSELPLSLQEVYFDKVLSKAKRGFLLMNYGARNPDNHFDYKKIKDLIPGAEKFEEIPRVNEGNHLIVWGHK